MFEKRPPKLTILIRSSGFFLHFKQLFVLGKQISTICQKNLQFYEKFHGTRTIQKFHSSIIRVIKDNPKNV